MESILKEKLSDLEKVDAPLDRFLKMFEKERVLVETSMIESFLIGPCRQVNFSAREIVTETKIDACVLSLVYKCEKGHGGVWYSKAQSEHFCHSNPCICSNPYFWQQF